MSDSLRCSKARAASVDGDAWARRWLLVPSEFVEMRTDHLALALRKCGPVLRPLIGFIARRLRQPRKMHGPRDFSGNMRIAPSILNPRKYVNRGNKSVPARMGLGDW
jgi:hypothetical protein